MSNRRVTTIVIHPTRIGDSRHTYAVGAQTYRNGSKAGTVWFVVRGHDTRKTRYPA